MATNYIMGRVSRIPLINNSGKDVPHLALNFSFGKAWLPVKPYVKLIIKQ